MFSFSQNRELAAGQFTYYPPTLRDDLRSQISDQKLQDCASDLRSEI